MKNLLMISFALFTILATSCSKEDEGEVKTGAFEDWKLVSISGGITGNGFDADFSSLRLYVDGTYEVLSFDVIVSSGTYKVIDAKLSFTQTKSGTKSVSIVGDGPYDQSFVKETMILAAPCCDRYQYNFTRNNG